MHRRKKLIGFVLLGVGCLWQAVPSWAATQDPLSTVQVERAPVVRPRTSLADRIPNVSARWFRKAWRTEINPTIGMSFNDPFYKHLIMGGSIRQHFNEWLFVGIGGDYNMGFQSEPSVTGGGVERDIDHNSLTYTGRGEIFWAPLYGKIGLFGAAAIHFDTYIGAGVGVAGFTRGSPGVVGSFVIGQHYFVNPWLAINLELRDQLFNMARHPSVDANKQLENLLTANVGVSFFLPVPGSPKSATAQKSMP